MTKNCLLCGVGGQGVVLASKLIAYCALSKGYNAKTTDTIGMAQRGGSVVSHVRIGDEIHSPIIPYENADVIIAFEPAEAVRALPYLKKDGTVIVNNKAVTPVTSSLSGNNYNGDEMLHYLRSVVKNLYVINGNDICESCGSAKVLNIALLGASAQTGSVGFSLNELSEAIKSNVKERFYEMNIKALKLGAETIK